jgi:hypothetical protein
MASTDRNTFKITSHEDAYHKGFFSGMTFHRGGSATATPNYPGVALMTVNPLTGKKAAEALVQIIPADKNVVYCDVVASGANGDEVTINMTCLSKQSSTPVRFLLGNLSDEKTRFSISDGRNTMIDLVVSANSYSKIPGTDKGKEVILGDTRLESSSASQQNNRPATGTHYTIKIGKQISETKGYMATFDNSTKIDLHSMKGARVSPVSTSACSVVSRGPPSGVIFFGMACAKGGEEENLETDGGDSDDGESTSCASAVTSTVVGTHEYASTAFTSEVIFSQNIFFTKTLYVPPKPVDVEPIYPQLTKCGGGQIFFCPHGTHQLKNNPSDNIASMNCPCVDSDNKKRGALTILKMMAM